MKEQQLKNKIFILNLLGIEYSELTDDQILDLKIVTFDEDKYFYIQDGKGNDYANGFCEISGSHENRDYQFEAVFDSIEDEDFMDEFEGLIEAEFDSIISEPKVLLCMEHENGNIDSYDTHDLFCLLNITLDFSKYKSIYFNVDDEKVGINLLVDKSEI